MDIQYPITNHKRPGRPKVARSTLEKKANARRFSDEQRQRDRAQFMLITLRGKAKRSGAEMTLTREWFEERLAAGCCEVTGIPFDLNGKWAPFAPSVDQTDPGCGYTPENTKLVVFMYNMAKNTWKHEDVLKLAEALCQK